MRLLSVKINFLTLIFILLFINDVQLTSIKFDFNEIGKEHHTKPFYKKNLHIRYPIIRRGNIFKLDILTDYHYEYNDVLIFQMKIISLLKQSGMRLVGDLKISYTIKNRVISLKIHVPVTAPIGSWKIDIIFQKPNDVRSENVHIPYLVCLLNPWSIYDPVYVDKNLINFVTSPYDISFRGQERYIWLSNQFSEVALNSSLKALKNSQITLDDLSDPFAISRWLTQMTGIGTNYDFILRGEWDKKVFKKPERSPSFWTSSRQILLRYLKKDKPVRYGQCWVFAAVLVTLARSMGFAARAITGLHIGVDKNSNVDIDRGHNSYDSIWNFHSWVEIHFNSPQYIYKGWYLMDPTPQEILGQAVSIFNIPVAAIKRGDLTFSRIVQFLYSNVNGIVIFHDDNGRIYKTSRNSVGTKIWSGSVEKGRIIIEDRLLEYKYLRTAREDRLVYRQVCNSVRSLYYQLPHNERQKLPLPCPTLVSSYHTRSALSNMFTIDIDLKKAYYGQDLDITVKIHYLLKQSKNVSLSFVVDLVDNSNTRKHNLRKISKFFLFSNEHSTYTQKFTNKNKITGKDYLNYINFYEFIRVVAKVRHGKEIARSSKHTSFKAPKLIVTHKKVKKDNNYFYYNVNVNFTNPTSIALKDCTFSINGDEIDVEPIEKGSLEPKKTHSVKFKVKFQDPGEQIMIVSFYTSTLPGKIDETLSIDVE